MLVTGVSALQADEAFQEGAPGWPPFPPLPEVYADLTDIPPAAPTPNPSAVGPGTSLGEASWLRELPAFGASAAPQRDFLAGDSRLGGGGTHRHALSPGQSRHASVSSQSSRAGGPGVALHPRGARIPAGARVAGLSADSLLRGRGAVQSKGESKTARGGRGGGGGEWRGRGRGDG